METLAYIMETLAQKYSVILRNKTVSKKIEDILNQMNPTNTDIDTINYFKKIIEETKLLQDKQTHLNKLKQISAQITQNNTPSAQTTKKNTPSAQNNAPTIQIRQNNTTSKTYLKQMDDLLTPQINKKQLFENQNKKNEILKTNFPEFYKLHELKEKNEKEFRSAENDIQYYNNYNYNNPDVDLEDKGTITNIIPETYIEIFNNNKQIINKTKKAIETTNTAIVENNQIIKNKNIELENKNKELEQNKKDLCIFKNNKNGYKNLKELIEEKIRDINKNIVEEYNPETDENKENNIQYIFRKEKKILEELLTTQNYDVELLPISVILINTAKTEYKKFNIFLQLLKNQKEINEDNKTIEFENKITETEKKIENTVQEINSLKTKLTEEKETIKRLNGFNEKYNTKIAELTKQNTKIGETIKKTLKTKKEEPINNLTNFMETNGFKVEDFTPLLEEAKKAEEKAKEAEAKEAEAKEAEAKEAEAKEAEAKEAEAKEAEAKEAEDTTNYYTPTVKSKTVNEDKDYMYQTDTKPNTEEHKLKPEPTNINIIPTIIPFKENPDIVPITEPTPRNKEETQPGNYNPNIYKHPNQNNERKKLVLSKNDTPEYSFRFHDSENETNRTETTDIKRTFPDNIKTDNNSVDSAKDTIPSPRNENPEDFIIKNTTEIIKQLGIVKNKDFIKNIINILSNNLNNNIRSAISNIPTPKNDEKQILECLKFIFLFVENDKWCNKNGQKVNVVTGYVCSQNLNDTDLTTQTPFVLYQEEQNYYTKINNETYIFENFGINKIEPQSKTLNTPPIYETIPVQ